MAGGIREAKQRKSEMTTFPKNYLEVPEEEAANSYELLVSRGDQAGMEFAAASLKLKPGTAATLPKFATGRMLATRKIARRAMTTAMARAIVKT